jgi:hypothetical protein
MDTPRFLVDAWIQHPSPAFLRSELFARLRRCGVASVDLARPMNAAFSAPTRGGTLLRDDV